MEAGRNRVLCGASRSLNEKAEVTVTGVLEDCCGDWHLAVRRHRELMNCKQGDGGSLQKLAVA